MTSLDNLQGLLLYSFFGHNSVGLIGVALCASHHLFCSTASVRDGEIQQRKAEVRLVTSFELCVFM